MFSNLPSHPFLLHWPPSALPIPPPLTLSLSASMPKPITPSSLSARGLPSSAHRARSLSSGSASPASPAGYLLSFLHSASFSFAFSSFHLKRNLPSFYITLHYHSIPLFLHSQVFKRVTHTNSSLPHLPLMTQPTVAWFPTPSHLCSD